MKKNSFIKSVSFALIIVIIGKMFGFIKQIVLAYYYGTSISSDIFFTSYSFISGIATMVFSAVALIALPQYEKKKGKINKDMYLSSIIKFCVPIIFLLSVLIIVFSKEIALVLAPGFSVEERIELSRFLQFLVPAFVMSAFNYLINVSLESNKKFIPGKIFALIFNSMIVLSTILLYSRIGTISLIFATIFSYLINIIITITTSRKYFSIKKVNIAEELIIKDFLLLLIPVLVGNAIVELNSIVDKAISSGLSYGSISAMTYGASINEIVTVLIIGTVSSVFYPYITTMIQENGDIDKIKKRTFNLIDFLICLLIPLTIVFGLSSNTITKVIFLRGSFNLESAKLTSYVIFGYSLGFVPSAIRNILLKVHYSCGDTKKPMINGIITVFSNIILSLLLSKYLGIFGIALATSISSFISACYALSTIKMHFGDIKQFFNVKKIAKLFVLIIISFSIYYLLCKSVFNDNIIIFILLTVIYFVVYYFLINILKVDGYENINNIARRIVNKIKK